jgi:hypothetical protein
LGLLGLLLLVALEKWCVEPPRPAARSAENPSVSGPRGGEGDTHEEPVRAFAIAASSSGTAHDENGAPQVPSGCKRFPLRGCAPAKDERGCYHCVQCARPFHYGANDNSVALVMMCPEMAAGSLYVDLADKAAPQGSAAPWRVSVTVDGHRSEQTVTPNLGSAHFGEIRGGNVELSAALSNCDPRTTACEGDMNLSVVSRATRPPP